MRKTFLALGSSALLFGLGLPAFGQNNDDMAIPSYSWVSDKGERYTPSSLESYPSSYCKIISGKDIMYLFDESLDVYEKRGLEFSGDDNVLFDKENVLTVMAEVDSVADCYYITKALAESQFLGANLLKYDLEEGEFVIDSDDMKEIINISDSNGSFYYNVSVGEDYRHDVFYERKKIDVIGKAYGGADNETRFVFESVHPTSGLKILDVR